MTICIRQLLRHSASAAALVLLFFGLSQMTAIAAPAAGTPAPATARIYVYRAYEPWQTLATPYLRFNGAAVGLSRPGAATYRDVPPGRYTVSVDSDGADAYQFATIDVVAGETAYIKVESLAGWDSGGGGGRGSAGWARDTFYTRLIPDPLAAREMIGMPLYGG